MLKLIKAKNNLKLLSKVSRWHFNYYILNRSSPLVFVLYITTKCNFKCQMCNIWKKSDKMDLNAEKIKSVLKEVSKSCYYFTISGGEPLLRKDIFEILSFAKQQIPYVHLVTNGYLVNEDIAKKLAKTKIDEVSISIDGLEKTHDNIRGVKGAYKNAVNAIILLKKFAPDIKIVVNTIIVKDNVQELKELTKLTESLKVYQKFQPINQHPSFHEIGRESKKLSDFTSEDIAEIRKFLDYISKKRHVINSSYFLSEIPNYFTKNTNHGIFKEKCNLQDFYCEVFEGRLYPCLSPFNWENGYVLDEGFKKVYYSKDYRKRAKQLTHCRLCKENMYVCYLEPRITFPLTNFIKYQLK